MLFLRAQASQAAFVLARAINYLYTGREPDIVGRSLYQRIKTEKSSGIADLPCHQVPVHVHVQEKLRLLLVSAALLRIRHGRGWAASFLGNGRSIVKRWDDGPALGGGAHLAKFLLPILGQCCSC